ncbi:hypothetical protein [Thalassovita sp.]|uniref:hypothetical protein n=1 Tax=Thalassovita sp. TaxID=1979401 RepID=UPI002B273F4B|nr:hypothetical protein [Thalassovita sp.]
MRNYDATTVAYLTGQTDLVAYGLLWVTAKDRDTGAPQTLGLWTGDDHHDFVIGGETRTYYGAGAVLGLGSITSQVGLEVRMQRFSLNALSTEVAQLLRGYDARFAPVELHRALFWPESMTLAAEPHRLFKGFVDEAPITTPPKGGTGRAEIVAASSARMLTIPLSLKKSDQTQRQRGDDRFRRYIDVSGQVDVWWGQTRRTE